MPLLLPSWLIAIAYWLAGGFIKSGLGSRIAYSMVAAFGKTTLGLTYSLVLGEALLSPAIPSVAARSGGIFFPLAKALCLACGSDPGGCSSICLVMCMQGGVFEVKGVSGDAQQRWVSQQLILGMVLREALCLPAIPSVAARSVGISFPLVKALWLACGSDPGG